MSSEVVVPLSEEPPSVLVAVAAVSVLFSSGAAQELTPSARTPTRDRIRRGYRKILEVAMKFQEYCDYIFHCLLRQSKSVYLKIKIIQANCDFFAFYEVRNYLKEFEMGGTQVALCLLAPDILLAYD